jgi:methionyl-tRNA synthetase
MDEHKMSKSLGNVLDPFAIIEMFGTDALRYYCYREVSFGLDGNVSPAGFEERYTAELANDYGNLASRTLNMLRRYTGGHVPDAQPDPTLAADFDPLPGEVCELLDRAEVTQALERIWQRVRRLNRYVEERKPWELAKADDPALPAVLRALAEGLRTVTVLLHAYLPESTGKLLAALGDERIAIAHAAFGAGRPGAEIAELAPLFPKIA